MEESYTSGLAGAGVAGIGKISLSDKFNEKYRVVRPDGSMRFIHDRGFPIVGENGEVAGWAGIAEDITEHKLSEEKSGLRKVYSKTAKRV